MIFGKTKLELKVGIFVFIGLSILVFFILSIGGLKTWSSGYNVNFVFSFVNGTKIGAPVRLAGVDVGRVKTIELFRDQESGRDMVKLDCWIKSSTSIPKDSAVLVNTLGMLGEKYIEIMPGKNYDDLLKADECMTGTDPVTIQEITDRAKDIADKIDVAMTRINNKEGTVGKFLFDDGLYNELEAFAADIHKNPWKLMWREK